MSVSTNPLSDNYFGVIDRIRSTAERADRDPNSIQLIAVSKYVDTSMIRRLHELGCCHFGESRPQVLWKKAKELADLDIHWHLIGHLQSNKIRRTIPATKLLHSGDSLRILELVNEEATKAGQVVDILAEVNISGDTSKHGFTQETLTKSLDRISNLENICVQGLMAMAGRLGGTEQAKYDFEKMAVFREHLSQIAPDNLSMEELSMGMSGDFELAIQHGATMVRIGSLLFKGT
ncbi:YggS family pyridoxal phosphate-dependent enzyme [Mariniblastus sp.]|jgi:hypothetical protein|nr:YggS family pyridoxal phosphate-dependent enzyme [Mariniblastus sp.]MDB4756358.1 YggS family pyridoxal phosphate-dependent enzyme [Mariniblastus sp.]